MQKQKSLKSFNVIFQKLLLFSAGRFDNLECVECLIEASASETNDADLDGRTPLMLASMNGNYDLVKLLLSLGADLAKRSRNRHTGFPSSIARFVN